ncbi:6045_t:CDS:2 [Funneliformis geosporum]|nr:6045_t:CDS:2 [Funneliformis geosporum]
MVQPLVPQQLPLRLYNTTADQVVETQSTQTIDSYAALDAQEKGEEVKKQRIYYSNAAVTLVAIDAKIEEKKVNLGLVQALHAVKHRKQTVALDGIYSILGLLPYGEKVEVKYKENDHKYTEEELEKTLLDIMKLAVQEGFYYEPLAWIGERRNEPEL